LTGQPEAAETRLLLALPLLECARPVPVDRLVDLTWEQPPPSARRVVFAHVARLRKVLAGAAGHGVALVTEPTGYVLRVEPERVDVHLFRQLVDRARSTTDPVARGACCVMRWICGAGPPLEDPCPVRANASEFGPTFRMIFRSPDLPFGCVAGQVNVLAVDGHVSASRTGTCPSGVGLGRHRREWSTSGLIMTCCGL
jgi:prepilin-type processing-associated H-X9-DG protein